MFGARAGDAIAADAASGAWPAAATAGSPRSLARDGPQRRVASERRHAGRPRAVLARRAAGAACGRTPDSCATRTGSRHAASVIAAWRAQPRDAAHRGRVRGREPAARRRPRSSPRRRARRESVGAHFRADDPARLATGRPDAAASPGRAIRRPVAGGSRLMLTRATIDRVVAAALEEDAPWGDLTSEYLIAETRDRARRPRRPRGAACSAAARCSRPRSG